MRQHNALLGFDAANQMNGSGHISMPNPSGSPATVTPTIDTSEIDSTIPAAGNLAYGLTGITPSQYGNESYFGKPVSSSDGTFILMPIQVSGSFQIYAFNTQGITIK